MERTLDQRLDHVRGELLKMGGAVEESIAQAVRSLSDRDNDLAEEVLRGGDLIDEWEVRNEEECIKLLAVQQPVASDLRLIATMMKINYDLERTNDQAVNIAQRALVLNRMPLLKPLIDIPRMAEITQGMVKDALDAFVERNVELANDVRRRDDVVDGLRDQVFRELLTYLHDSSGADTIDRAIHLILVSRHLERIGDHASNIAENAVYLVQGRIVRHKKDELALGEETTEA
jgi:phosphate transport system protein